MGGLTLRGWGVGRGTGRVWWGTEKRTLGENPADFEHFLDKTVFGQFWTFFGHFRDAQNQLIYR